MNATKWKSLTQFAAHLGREGLCRVEETEKGLFISYIDRSPETLRRREAIMKKERQDRGDEEREQRLIQEQVERAQQRKDPAEEEVDPEAKILQRKEGEKVKLNLGFGKKTEGQPEGEAKAESKSKSPEASAAPGATPEAASETPPTQAPTQAPKLSLSLGTQKPKNVFASAAKKNPLAGKKGPVMEPAKKMTEQERIMKQEMEAMERKRRGGPGMPQAKRPRVA
jgi:DNA/RNA-binding protein KIN17